MNINPVRAVVLDAGRWARARKKWRSLTDSKSAKPAQIEAARKEFAKASDDLEQSVRAFEEALVQMKQSGVRSASRGPKLKIHWGKMLGALAAGAQAIESAVTPEYIDTKGE